MQGEGNWEIAPTLTSAFLGIHTELPDSYFAISPTEPTGPFACVSVKFQISVVPPPMVPRGPLEHLWGTKGGDLLRGTVLTTPNLPLGDSVLFNGWTASGCFPRMLQQGY